MTTFFVMIYLRKSVKIVNDLDNRFIKGKKIAIFCHFGSNIMI